MGVRKHFFKETVEDHRFALLMVAREKRLTKIRRMVHWLPPNLLCFPF